MQLADRTAVITGAASGIGLALTERLLDEGMSVVMADIEADKLRSEADRLIAAGGAVTPVVCDVSDSAQIEALREAALAAHGSVHLLCNNAGVASGRPNHRTRPEVWDWVIGVNLLGPAYGCTAFAPLMVEQGEGHIVNTGSGASFVATPRLGPYCATKHAIVGLSEALRYELDGTGIGVSVLVPAGVNTNIGDAMVRPSADPDRLEDDFTVLTTSLDPTSLEMIEPDVVADVTMVGVKEGWDYIVMGPGQEVGVQRRYDEVVAAHRQAKERFPFLP